MKKTSHRNRTRLVHGGPICLTAITWALAVLCAPVWGASLAPPPVTGQTSCYDTIGNELNSCSDTGQDGDLQAGVAWPVPRFTDNRDGTVTDNLTGLAWSQDANAPGPSDCAPGIKKNMQEALDYVACLNTRSYLQKNDWRLPNINELRSLFDGQPTNVASWLSSHFFNVQSDIYKSSTFGSGQNNSQTPWVINFADGSIFSYSALPHSRNFVWPVRTALAADTVPAPTARTGAAQCYDFTTQTMGNACAGTGQDGELKAGVPWPNPRFKSDSATISDSLSRLQWIADGKVQHFGSCTGGALSWQNALFFINCLNTNLYLGKGNWRLPNLSEMLTLTNAGTDAYTWLTTLTPTGFNLVQTPAYWTSTTYEQDPSKAWTFSFAYGSTAGSSKTIVNNVLPVRDALDTVAVPKGGTFTAVQNVTLIPITAGLPIYYTTDGSTPTTSSALYSAPIAISQNKVLKFFAVYPNGKSEYLETESYVIDPDAPVTTVSPSGGTATSVTLSCADANSGCDKTYYTTDGTPPTTASAVYTAPIAVSGPVTLKFFSTDLAGNAETPNSASFSPAPVDATAPVTTASPASRTYPSALTVTLSCDDGTGSGCDKIYYTTDGSVPTTSSTQYSGPFQVSASTVVKFFSKDNSGNTESTKSATYTISTYKKGDANHNGTIDLADGLLIYQFYKGSAVPTTQEAGLADVAPLSGGTPVGDGTITLGDVIIILRYILGATQW